MFLFTIISLTLLFFVMIFGLYLKADDMAQKNREDWERFEENLAYACKEYGRENVQYDHTKRLITVRRE